MARPRLLAIDIGNTNVVFGLFRGQRLVEHWRLETSRATRARWQRAFRSAQKKLKYIDGVCISSVVPRLDPIVRKGVQQLLKTTPLFVGGKNVRVGADRLANAVAAHHRYRRACIVVDFGTATTFDYVTAAGDFAGGAIAPGVRLGCEALCRGAAKLSLVPIRTPPRVIGKRTSTNIQSGVVHGHVGLVDHLVRAMSREIGKRPVVIATGGLALLIAPLAKTIQVVVPHLTLEGIRLIWEKERP